MLRIFEAGSMVLIFAALTMPPDEYRGRLFMFGAVWVIIFLWRLAWRAWELLWDKAPHA